MIKFDDFFNFSNAQAETNKAVKEIDRLTASYQKWITNLEKNNQSLIKTMKIVVDQVKSLSATVKSLDPALAENQATIAKSNKGIDTMSAQYKELTAQVDRQQKEIKELNSELTRLNSTRSKNKRNLSEVERLTIRLNKAQSQQGKEAVALRTRIAALNAETRKQTKETLNSSNAYDRLKTNTNKAQLEFKRLAAQFGVSSKQAVEARRRFEKLDNELRDINNTARDGRRDVGRYGLALKNVGGSLRNLAGALGVTGGVILLAQAFRDGFKTIVQFDKSAAELAGVLGKTRKEIADLTRDAQRLGGTTAKTAQEVTDLQIAYARLGFTQAEIVNLTEDTIDGSIALNAELDETANLTGAVIRTFDDLSTTDAGRVLDALTLSTQRSALNFSKLDTALPIVAGAANAAGVSFEQLLALLGKLSDAGIDASSSATALRNIFIESAAQGLDYSEILDKIGASQDQLTAANDEFGKRAAVSATILSNLRTEVVGLENDLQNAGGTAKSVAETQLDTLSGSITLLSSAWDGFILSLENGEGAISRVFRGLIDFTTQAINGLSTLGRSADDVFNEISENQAAKSLAENIARTKEEFKQFVAGMKEAGTEFASLTEAADAFIQADKEKLSQLQRSGSWDKEQSRIQRQQIEDLKGRVQAIDEVKAAEVERLAKEKAAETTRAQQAAQTRKQEEDLANQKLAETLKQIDAENAKADATVNAEQEGIEAAKKAMDEREALLQKFLQEAEEGIRELGDVGEEVAEAFETPLQKFGNLMTSLFKGLQQGLMDFNDFGGAAVNLFTAINARAIESNLARTREIEIQKERELSAAGQNADQRAAIEERYNQELDRLQQERLQKERQIAIAQKAFAIGQSLINTALAVVGALAPPPIGLGPVAGIPLAAKVGALGALQTAAIAVQRIPQFAEGTDFHKGGLAIVGDGGQREVISDKKGNAWVTPDKDTLVDLPKGYEVFKSISEAKKSLGTMSVNEAGSLEVRKGSEAAQDQLLSKLYTQAQKNGVMLSSAVKQGLKDMSVHQTMIENGELKHYIEKGNEKRRVWNMKNGKRK